MASFSVFGFVTGCSMHGQLQVKPARHGMESTTLHAVKQRLGVACCAGGCGCDKPYRPEWAKNQRLWSALCGRLQRGAELSGGGLWVSCGQLDGVADYHRVIVRVGVGRNVQKKRCHRRDHRNSREGVRGGLRGVPKCREVGLVMGMAGGHTCVHAVECRPQDDPRPPGLAPQTDSRSVE